MSEEDLTEEEKLIEEEIIARRLQLCSDLEEVGEKELANKLFAKIEKGIEFVELDDWIHEQICSTFPTVDVRCLTWCCSPSNNCPFRAAVLRKLGWNLGDYIGLKQHFAEEIGEILNAKKD